MTPQTHHFGRRVRLEAVAPGGKRVPVWSDPREPYALTTQCGPVAFGAPVIVSGPGRYAVEATLKEYGYKNVTVEDPDRPTERDREALRLACHLSDDPCEAP
jgi:hypothetical protein